ncbi:hypothetical protein [Muriicola marianensis]|uniref:Lipoprotein n=1 Tax=Muriicola marianensis TaxID=1324801 RepID=A0ABQ1QY38_9FLAO|nr:hypothetical protein [Muriicola marianensis]GGD49271.1 lipoprotein [Muriicola marianensis]
MFKKTGFLFLILALAGCSYDRMPEPEEELREFRGEVVWIRSFGGSGDDTPRSVVETLDRGFAVLGYSKSTDGDLQGKSTQVNDYWLLKTDRNGDAIWSRTYGGSMDDRGQAVIQTSDGGFSVTGYSMSSDGDASNNEGFHDNWVLRLDGLGNLLWEQSFGFSGHDHSYDLVETPEGGLFFTGFLDITSARADGYTEKHASLTRHGVGEFWGTKLDSGGDIEWRSYFGGTNNDRAHAVARAHDGGYVMAGFSESDDFDISDPRGSYDFWVVKVSETGELAWQHSYGGTEIDIANDVAQTRDGGYVITGSTFSADGDVSASHGGSDAWVIKTDAQGQLLWERTYGGSAFEAAEAICPTLDGGYVIVGNSRSTDQDVSTNAGENDLWIFKVDSHGQLLWEQALGGTDLEFGFDVLETSDGAIIVVGETASTDLFPLENRGGTDLIMVRIE